MKTAEGTIEQLSQESSKMEDSLQHHRDSASMLGLTSSARSGGSHIMEMQGDSRGLTNEVNADRESIEVSSTKKNLFIWRSVPLQCSADSVCVSVSDIRTQCILLVQ